MTVKMRVIGSLMVLVLAFALMPAIASAAPAITQGIRGVVKDASTGVPIPFAEIDIDYWGGAHVAFITADYDGSYSCSLSPGDYDVSASASWRESYSTPSAVTVTAGMATIQDFSLARQQQYMQSVYRFFNMKGGVHFYTASDEEFINVYKKFPTYHYDGIAYEIAQGPDLLPTTVDYGLTSLNTVPLYRFYCSKTGVHFYTSSATERDNVKARYPKIYRYEGVAYNVASTNVMGDGNIIGSPVYRFYNPFKNTHFYSADRSEISAKTSLSQIYHYEGIGYYTGGWLYVPAVPEAIGD